jgi:hypothetical protein
MKLLLLIFIATVLIGTYLSFRNPSLKSKQIATIIESVSQSPKEDDEVDEEEEIKARIEQEIQMTMDPSTGYVPTERLIAAQARAQQINRLNREENIQSLTWIERGPNNLGGRSRAILIDQNDATGNTIFIGSVGGGLWRTTNFKSATPAWTQITSISANLAITTLAQDPNSLSTMYAGTGEGFNNADAIRGLGIYKSIDGGLTWNLLASTTTGGANASDFNYVQKILVYTNGDVYASGISSAFCNRGGILKSTNGGATWKRVIGTYDGSGLCTGAVDFSGYDIEMSKDGDLYASVVDNSNVADNFDLSVDTTVGKIYYSPAGATVGNSGAWINITPPPPPDAGSYWQRIELACSPTNNNTVYALLQGNSTSIGGIRVSTDAGSTWSNIDNTTLWCDNGASGSTDFSRGQAWYDLALAVKPDDDQTVFAGGVDLMKTTDGGTSWVQNTQWASGCTSLPNIHADNHNIVYLPGSTTEFIVVNDGGVYYTSDGGNSYTNKSAGYRTIQYYGAALHPSSGSDYMLAGAQDNGSHKFVSAGLNSVTTVTGGDGGFCFIDQDNPNYQFTSYTYADYEITTNGGSNFNKHAYFGSSSKGRFINPTDYDNTRNIIYAAYTGGKLLRINDITLNPVTSNSITFSGIASKIVSAIKVDPNTADRVWVAFSGGVPKLYYVDNANGGSPTINAITLPTLASGSYISSIDVEQGNSNHILLTLSNYGIASVYETTDMSTTWTSLDNNGVNLPDMPVRWGIFIPGGYNARTTSTTAATGGIMLATELGVWTASSINGTSTVWTANNTGLANVRVDQLVIRNSDKMVAAATHGRGLFTTLLLSSPLPVTLLRFDGLLQQKNILLEWTTSSEFNSSHFDLEKSFDGTNFRKIATIPASGNSSSLEHYSYVDREPPSEMNYYRLKMVDENSHAVYSDIKLIRNTGIGQNIYVLGNPFSDKISFQFARIPQTPVKIKLVNMEGKILLMSEYQKLSQQQITLNSSRLIRGNYVLHVETDQKSFSKQIVKQ